MKNFLSNKSWLEWLRNGVFLALLVSGTCFAIGRLWSPHSLPGKVVQSSAHESSTGVEQTVERLNAAFKEDWKAQGLQPTSPAPQLTLARRLSLALAGTLPSVQEIRAFEAQPEAERIQWYLSRLFADRRYSDYFAERFARAFVGVDDGPFIVYRRRRLVEWLSDALHENRPYDKVVKELISSKGVWTTHPEVNFVTATVAPEKGPDKAKLAARVSRAFLGVRMDCVECHDGKLGSTWKQQDFHRLAAFFGQTETALGGVQDNPKHRYEYRFLKKKETEVVPAVVPWSTELVPATASVLQAGSPRQKTVLLPGRL